MSNPTNPRQEQPSTYFVQDRSNKNEFARLQLQDHLVTTLMGGVLSEQPDPTIFQRVLDVGCGTGSWLIEVAEASPATSLLVGVDINSKLVEYAQAQAEAHQVGDRVQFRVMDALRMLEFPTNFFDLVNHRLSVSYLRTWDWSKLLQEYQRVARPGGVIRITESDMAVESSSPALTQLFELLVQAFHRAGHLFTPESDGLTRHLARLLSQHGIRNVQTRAYTSEQRAGTPEAQRSYEDLGYLFRTVVPFLRKWGHIPDNYEEIYQQAMSEMQQPDFVATSHTLTAWGVKG